MAVLNYAKTILKICQHFQKAAYRLNEFTRWTSLKIKSKYYLHAIIIEMCEGSIVHLALYCYSFYQYD